METSGYKDFLDHVKTGNISKSEADTVNEYLGSFDKDGSRKVDSKEDKPKVTRKVNKITHLYEEDPERYAKYELDYNRVMSLIKKWKNPDILYTMLTPEDNGKTAKKILHHAQDSIKKSFMMKLMARLRCDKNYITGKKDRIGKAIPEVYFNNDEIYILRYFYFGVLKDKDISLICKEVGIAKDYMTMLCINRKSYVSEDIAKAIYNAAKKNLASAKKLKFEDMFIFDNDKAEKYNVYRLEDQKEEENPMNIPVTVPEAAKKQLVPSRSLGFINKVCKNEARIRRFLSGSDIEIGELVRDIKTSRDTVKSNIKKYNTNADYKHAFNIAAYVCVNATYPDQYTAEELNNIITEKFEFHPERKPVIEQIKKTVAEGRTVKKEELLKKEDIHEVSMNELEEQCEKKDTNPVSQEESNSVSGTVEYAPKVDPTEDAMELIKCLDLIDDIETLESIGDYISGLVTMKKALKKISK
jgi:hypothetical protein